MGWNDKIKLKEEIGITKRLVKKLPKTSKWYSETHIGY